MDITIGQYFPKNSLIHRLDPRTKLLAVIFYMVMIFVSKNTYSFLVSGLLMVSVIALSKIPFRYYFKGLKPILIIMIFTSMLNLFLSGGEVIYEIPYLGWTITDEGLRLSVFMVLRLSFLIIGTSALTFTTSPVTLTDGMEALLRPFSKIGVPSHEIAMMMTIALRFIPTFAEEADKIKKAQSARGADFSSGSLLSRAKAMIPILVPLFVGAFRRADELAVAMEARCYRGGSGRTSLKKLSFALRDYLSFTLIILLLTGVILLEIFL